MSELERLRAVADAGRPSGAGHKTLTRIVPSAIAVLAGLAGTATFAADYTVPPNISNGVSLTPSDTLLVNVGGLVTNTSNNDAVSGTGAISIINRGTIAGSGTNAAAIELTGDVSIVTNYGLLSADLYNVVYIHANMAGSFTNVAGASINGTADDTVRITGTTNAFSNFGTIRNSSNDEDEAVQFDGAIIKFNNTGLIEAQTGRGVLFQGGISGTGTDGAFNSGQILQHGTTTAASAVNIWGLGGNFTNQAGGEISGANGLYYSSTAITATVVNAGTITATVAGGLAVALTDQADGLTLESTSVINGTVDARGGSDALILGGAPGSGTFSVAGIGASQQYRNFESYSKTGASTWTLTGTSSQAIGWAMDAGILSISGNMANMNFALTGGTLKGGGSAGDVSLTNATIAPGNSVGTLTVNDIIFGAGSIYEVEVSGNSADRIIATGDADLTLGTVNVTGTASACGDLKLEILSSANRIGTFAIESPTGLITYEGNSVFLNYVGTGGRTFAGFGETANQEATARALDELGCGNQPYSTAVNALTDDQVPAAMDALSGEGHASIAASMVENAGHVPSAVGKRLEQAFDKVDSQGTASAFTGGRLLDPGVLEGLSIWGDSYGGFAQRASDGNAATVQSATGGVVVGLDGPLGNGWIAGIMGGLGVSSISSGATEGSSVAATLGAYAGGELGVVRVKAGAAYSRHLIDTSRSIVFPGVNDTVTARYQAGTIQGFLEASTDIDVGAVTLTPFARLQGVTHSTDAFTESGGEGALDTQASVANALFVTLGIGAEHEFVLNDTMLVTARGSVGWRHAFADQVVVANAFAGGGPFTIASAGIAGDVVVVSAGASVDIDTRTSLDIGYESTLGSGYAAHALKVTLSGRF